MIFYTIVPPELIFSSEEDYFTAQKEHTYDGIPMIVEQSGNMYKVVRIMSSNPADYLRSDLHPGSFISMNHLPHS